MNSKPNAPQLVDHLFRREAGRMVSTLIRVFGPEHLNLAEDVVQEALVQALRTTEASRPTNLQFQPPASWRCPPP
jgi:predicted RNA polymerase sigma factor